MAIPRTTRQPTHRRCRHCNIIKSAYQHDLHFPPHAPPRHSPPIQLLWLLRSSPLIYVNSMSAPPLSEAEPISVGASFYNSINATFYPYEATPEAVEGMAPPQNNDTTPGLGQSVPSDSGFVIAADLDSVPASYIGEDGRLTLLREIDTIFRDMATNSSGSRATISQETLRLLPIVSRTVIQYVSELQANNSQLHMSNARLQATQGGGQARAQQMEAHIAVLQREIELVKDTNLKLQCQSRLACFFGLLLLLI
ncbi:hypothetical protein BKA65DRAFT_48649 [Rhexocercosporidium sp. MPI-PUGE-AT-0058]|nr:hypothetical protein BKA65DRAFT_48649 [Rhexocercosporidium sp. MPI-PUGE-AT-0058]